MPKQSAEVASCYLFLASYDSSIVTGQVLHPTTVKSLMLFNKEIRLINDLQYQSLLNEARVDMLSKD